ncbi:MAG: hypothetical protein FWE39_03090 [Nocardiaceae bacterium]|nr:hypothetical protein [Nocardiaceae bacterium]
MTELSDALGANRSTILNIVRQLVDAGWLRKSDRQYLLGPGLIPLGRAAESGAEGVLYARAELGQLAANLGVGATATALAGDAIVVVDSLGGTSGRPSSLLVGQRLPAVPPSGSLFVASDEDASARWIAAVTDWPEEKRLRLMRALDAIRERKFSVERLTPSSLHVRTLVAELGAAVMSDEFRSSIVGLIEDLGTMEYLEVEFDPGATYPVSYIAAPVFSREGSVVLTIALHLLREVDGAEIDRIGQQLLRVADRVSQEVQRANGAIPSLADQP